jgi:hypothetical protein
MGEAPVKYELTGASGHFCEPKFAVWRRPIRYLVGPLGNRLSSLFPVISVLRGINGVSEELIATRARGVSLQSSQEPKQQTESALPGPAGYEPAGLVRCAANREADWAGGPSCSAHLARPATAAAATTQCCGGWKAKIQKPSIPPAARSERTISGLPAIQ